MTDKQDDLNLPSTVVTRIIKDALPEGCAVAKDAKLALSRAASVFVLYLTSQANNIATQKNRKTISNQDVLEALQVTEFGRFEGPLNDALAQFTKSQKEKKEKKQVRDDSKTEGDDDDIEEIDIEENDVTS